MAEIQEHVLGFINTNLSLKSQQYIKQQLFVEGHRIEGILSKIPTLDPNDPQPIIGYLTEVEEQLFFIRESLNSRINGTRERIDEVHDISILDCTSVIAEAKTKYATRNQRLSELLKDYQTTYHCLNRAIQQRLETAIEEALEENPKLLKRRYTGFDSGYDFQIVNTNTIVLTNYYCLGGD